MTPWGILDYFLNLCLRLKRQSLKDRTVSSTWRALAGGIGPQPQHLAIRHNRILEVKNIKVLEMMLLEHTHLMDMLWEDQRESQMTDFEHHRHYPMRTIYHFAMITGAKQIGFRLTSKWGRRESAIYIHWWSTQHETNWQTWNVHGRNSLDFALGN